MHAQVREHAASKVKSGQLRIYKSAGGVIACIVAVERLIGDDADSRQWEYLVLYTYDGRLVSTRQYWYEFSLRSWS